MAHDNLLRLRMLEFGVERDSSDFEHDMVICAGKNKGSSNTREVIKGRGHSWENTTGEQNLTNERRGTKTKNNAHKTRLAK